MPYTFSHILLALLGTAVCGFGFLKRPKSMFELMGPRFVIPFAFWAATFGAFFYYCYTGRALDRHLYKATDQIGNCLIYSTLCMLMFWCGFVLPLGRIVAGPFQGLRVDVRGGDRDKVRHAGYALATAQLLFLLAVIGPRLFDSAWPSYSLPFVRKVTQIGVLNHALTFCGATLIGLGWPTRERRNPVHIFLCLFFLLVTSFGYMSAFSRGAGLPMAVAMIAYAIRNRSLKWWLLLLVGMWVIICGDAGLFGRFEHGHYGGVLPFLKQVFTQSIFRWDRLLMSTVYVNDSFTRLCVAIQASSDMDMHTLSPLKWFLFQVPVPRVFGFHPRFDVSLTRFVGGHGAWGYTMTMMGDTYMHFGFLGAMTFLIPGVVYRALNHLTIGAGATGPESFNPYFLVLVTSYLAWMMGLFNTYRAWVVASSYPFYMILIVMITIKLLRGPRSAPASQSY